MVLGQNNFPYFFPPKPSKDVPFATIRGHMNPMSNNQMTKTSRLSEFQTRQLSLVKNVCVTLFKTTTAIMQTRPMPQSHQALCFKIL